MASMVSRLWATAVKGEHKGKCFLFVKGMQEDFFAVKTVYNVLDKPGTSLHGFAFRSLTKEEKESPLEGPFLTRAIFEETRDALDYGYIITLTEGAFAGKKIGVNNRNTLKMYFNPSIAKHVSRHKERLHLGCQFLQVSYEEAGQFTANITTEINDYLLENHTSKRGRPRCRDVINDKKIKPVIGEVMVGPYKGIKFAFFGMGEIPKGFQQSGISRCTKQEGARHHGCTFRFSTIEEALPLRGKLTSKIVQNLTGCHHFLRPFWAIPTKGEYKGRRFPMLTVDDVRRWFTLSGVRGVLNGFHPTHHSFDFVYMGGQDKFSPDMKNVLTGKIVEEVKDTLAYPLIGTVVAPHLLGIRFGITSKQFAKMYLSPRAITKIKNGTQDHHKKCVFEVATYEKASALVGNITPGVITLLESKRKIAKGLTHDE